MSQQPKGKGQGGGKKPPNQPQSSKNLSDADFGPPLGARGKPKGKKQDQQAAKPKVAGQPQAGPSTGPTSQPSAWGKPVQSGPSVSQPPPAGGAWGKSAQATSNPTAAPAGPPSTAWGKPAEKPVQAAPARPPTNRDKKRQLDVGSSAGSTQKFYADEKTRGEAQRGSIHGRGGDEGKIIITKPGHISSKRGTTGIQLKVQSNYFDVLSRGVWQIYHYNVEISPTIENAAFKNALLVQQKETLGAFLYDRGSSVYLIRQLDADIEFQTRDRDGIEYLIKMTRVGLISSAEKEYLQVLNIIMKKALNALQLQLVGRDYFDPQASIRIPDFRLQLWPGYSTSIRQHEVTLLMNAEIKFKLMRDETLLDILIRCHNNNKNWQEEFTREILGSVVLTRYNNKTYKITDVNYTLTPNSTFERREGPISYFEYYRQVRNITIKDMKQPLLVSKPTERNRRSDPNQIINLVPELCYATGYTDQMRKDFRLMQATAAHTRVGPAGRIERLLTFNKRLQQTPGSIACFNEWLLNLNTKLVDVPARQLPAEIIMLGENRSQPADHNASWMNALQGRNSMNVSKNLQRWAVVIPRNIKKQSMDFIKMMMEVSRGMRFNVGDPTIVDVNDDRTVTLGNELQNLCQDNLQMIMVAVGNNSADRYSTIKKTCCVRNATPTQVVTSRVMDSRNMSKLRSVATKVAIQINAKIGGLPWTVDVKMDNIMFIGYDVCHDTHNRANSYGAVVATMDMRKSTHFFSAVAAHTNGEEMSNNLAVNVVKALKQYVSIHNVLPSRILFYRDGVGDGQLNYVYEHELQTLLARLKVIYGENQIRLAFVVVSKRINTKFFIGDQTNARNVPAGTVVDDVVTLPEKYDFFIVSQSVTQGTATPTNYNVLYDTFGLPPDKIQMMTYKMCHLYFNWSGTTRVPAPCQYAHKLAFLVGNYLHQAPSAGLQQLLYFL